MSDKYQNKDIFFTFKVEIKYLKYSSVSKWWTEMTQSIIERHKLIVQKGIVKIKAHYYI